MAPAPGRECESRSRFVLVFWALRIPEMEILTVRAGLMMPIRAAVLAAMLLIAG
jgi:hypothetical protein